jgi:mRNA interferase RelE/StbE
MRYTVAIKPKAAKFLHALTDKRLCLRLRDAIDALADDPRPAGSCKLQGADDLHRVRVGDYRVIYQIQDAVLVVLVVQIGHRREVYR